MRCNRAEPPHTGKATPGERPGSCEPPHRPPESGGETSWESGKGRQEAGDCRLCPRGPGSSGCDPNPSLRPPSASIPPRYTGRPPRAAITPFPEADTLTAGPPLAHARGSPTAASSRWVPNRPAASRPLLPLHRGVFSKPTAPTCGPELGTHHLPVARFASASCEESRPSGCTSRPWTRAATLPVCGPTRVLLTGPLTYHSTEEKVMIGL